MHLKFPVVPDCGRWTYTTSGLHDANKQMEAVFVTFGPGRLLCTHYIEKNGVPLYMHIKFLVVPVFDD
jgi:hypothetical protein